MTLRPSVTFHTHSFASQRIASEFYEADQIVQSPNNDANAITYAWAGDDLRFLPSLEYKLNARDFWITHNNRLTLGIQGQYNVALGYGQTRCFRDLERAHLSPSALMSDDPSICLSETFVNEGLEVDLFGNAQDDDTSHRGSGDVWRVGGFVQYSADVGKRLKIVAGARTDSHQEYGAQLSPRFSVVSSLPKGVYVKAQYANAFLYPAFLYSSVNPFTAYGASLDPERADISPQSIASYEVLVGLKNRHMRVELNGYLNSVTDFITYSVPRTAQAGRYEFANEGDVTVAGLEKNALFFFLDGRLTLNTSGALTVPVKSQTDDLFLVDGKLGGPTKFPTLMAGVIVNAKPMESLNVNTSLLYASEVVGQTVAETQFADIEGTDGQMYSSKPQEDYATESLLLNASLSYRPMRKWTVGLKGTNLLNRRQYRPGSTVVPLFQDGLRVSASARYEF